MDSFAEYLEKLTEVGPRLIAKCPESDEILAIIYNSTEWMSSTARDCLESTSISTETLSLLAVSLLVAVMFLGCVSYGSRQLHEQSPDSPSSNEVISIFDLAKTAYVPGHAENAMNLVRKLHFDMNYPIPSNGMTLFLCACISGNKDLVSFLLEQGGDVSVTNSDGDTCLYLATFACAGTRNDDLAILDLLISAGCEVNGKNHRGNTALHWAASKGDISVIKLLLKHGADPNIRNGIGVYPIGMATNAGYLRAGKLLKISPSDPNTPWDMFEPHTPVQARLGLLRPRKDHLVMSPRPKACLGLS